MSKRANKSDLVLHAEATRAENAPYRLHSLQPITNAAELERYGVSAGLGVAEPAARRRFPLVLWLVVIIPLMMGGVYNFFIAVDRYVSTASFVVREVNRGGVLSLGTSGSMTRSDDNSFAVAEFIQSRDAVDWLINHQALDQIFSAESVDWFSRFPSPLAGDSREDLYKHFQHYVDVDFNSTTGISTLSVQGFDPETATRLTSGLLDAAEALINDLNQRARADALEFATTLRNEAAERLVEAQARLTQFRNEQSVLNPNEEVTISNLLLTQLLKNLSEIDTQIAQLTATAPNNPRLEQLRQNRQVLADSIQEQRATMAGDNESLALKIEGFDRVRLERDLAEKALISAENGLDAVKQTAQESHLYLERIVSANTPDRYTYPLRYWNMILLAGICLSVFWLIRKTTSILTEDHR